MILAHPIRMAGALTLVGALAAVGACAGNGGSAQTTIATCADITAAITFVTPLRPKLSMSEDQTVLAFLAQAHPVCGADNPQTVVDAGLTVALNNITAIIAAHK